MTKMIKIDDKFKGNKRIESRRATFFIFLVLGLTLFMTQIVSAAWEFDNVKQVDEITGEIKIVNTFGLGKDIATMKLNTPHINRVFGGKDKLVAEFTINNYEGYENWHNNMKFYDRNKKGKEIQREFIYKYKDGNGKWIELNKKLTLPIGKITIGIFTDVYVDDNVEWIPKLYGKTIDEWAVWQNSFGEDLVAVFRFSNGSNSIKDNIKWVTDEGTPVYNSTNCAYESCVHIDVTQAIIINGSNSIMNLSSNNSRDWTLNFWSNVTDGGFPHFTNGVYLAISEATNKINWGNFLCAAGDGSGTLNYEKNMITIISNESGGFCYLNGVLDRTGSVYNQFGNNGIFQIPYSSLGITQAWFDELYFWNRSITTTELSSLYDSGTGTFWDGSTYLPMEIVVDLDAPVNDVTSALSSYYFSTNYTATRISPTNSTLYLWYGNGTLFDINTSSVDTALNSSNLSLSNLPIGSGFLWNYQVCGTNTTADVICSYATSNRTINFDIFSETSNTFRNETLEGSTERFEFNMTLRSGVAISSATLYYNGTAYVGAFTNPSGDDYSIYKTLLIPNLDAETNYTFYWEMLVSGEKQNSSFNNQTVNLLSLDDCTVYTQPLFNMTMYDEDFQTQLVAAPQNTSIKVSFDIYDTARTSKFANYSNNWTYINPARVCLANGMLNSSFIMDGVIEYSSYGRFVEFYNFYGYTLNYSTVNKSIPLYNLNSSLGEAFKITYKDSNFVAVKNAIFNIQRKYIEDGIFKTIEVPKSGSEGYTIGHLIPNDIIYNIIVTQNGINLATFTDIVANCQLPNLQECEINLNSYSSSILPRAFSSSNGATFTLTYNNTERIVKSISTIDSGIPATILLNITKFDNIGKTQVCTQEYYAAGGTLSCTIPSSFGNETIVARLYRDDVLIGTSIISLSPRPSDVYGSNLIFIGLLAVFTIIGVAITDDPMIYGITFVLGAIALVGLNIIYTPSIIGTGATILWFIVAVVLIFIKGSNRQ